LPWLEALKAGRTFATNGPLLGFALNGAAIGDTVQVSGKGALKFSVRLQSIVAVDHLDLVCNGRPVKSFLRAPQAAGQFSGSVQLKESGWCVVRAASEGARYPVLDNYVYATTSPIYVQVGGKPTRSPVDARYFVAWIDRVIESTTAYPDWNSPAEKQQVLERLNGARQKFVALQ
jgi:hypothetical protein